METLDRAPFGEVTAIEESKPYGKKLYDVEVDYWRNMSSDSCKEPYKTLPGHVFLLSDAKPESISDIQESKKSWAFLIVTEVSNRSFKVKASKELQVSNGIQASLLMVFLINITPNIRIWKAIDNNKSARWKVQFCFLRLMFLILFLFSPLIFQTFAMTLINIHPPNFPRSFSVTTF